MANYSEIFDPATYKPLMKNKKLHKIEKIFNSFQQTSRISVINEAHQQLMNDETSDHMLAYNLYKKYGPLFNIATKDNIVVADAYVFHKDINGAVLFVPKGHYINDDKIKRALSIFPRIFVCTNDDEIKQTYTQHEYGVIDGKTANVIQQCNDKPDDQKLNYDLISEILRVTELMSFASNVCHKDLYKIVNDKDDKKQIAIDMLKNNTHNKEKEINFLTSVLQYRQEIIDIKLTVFKPIAPLMPTLNILDPNVIQCKRISQWLDG